jgi:hypothetical protein
VFFDESFDLLHTGKAGEVINTYQIYKDIPDSHEKTVLLDPWEFTPMVTLPAWIMPQDSMIPSKIGMGSMWRNFPHVLTLYWKILFGRIDLRAGRGSFI